MTRTAARFAVDVDAARLPEEVIRRLSWTVIDTLGCIVSGLSTRAGQIVVDHCAEERGALEATLAARGRVSVASAAFGNCVLANALDFDAFGPEGHMAVVVVPAALAMAEALDTSGADLVAAIAVGMELGGRLGQALRRPARSAEPLTGHTFAVIGVAAAAGRLLKLSEEQMLNALGIAAYSAQIPTLRRFFSREQDAMTKYDHLGLAARNGIDAARLAQRGFTGDRSILDGAYPFWRLSGAEGFDVAALLEGLGESWRVRDLQHKAYPVGIGSIPMIDAVLEAYRASGGDVREVEQVEVRTATHYVHRNLQIRSAIEAWVDLRYAIAMALLGVRPLRSWYLPEQFARPDLASLMDRIHILPLPGARGRWAVEVTLRARGRSFEACRTELAAMGEAEISAKFMDNVRGFLPDAAAESLLSACSRLHCLESVSAITAALSEARAEGVRQ